MDSIPFRCSSCNHRMQVPREQAGEELECPLCGFVGRAPVPFRGRPPIKPLPTSSPGEEAPPLPVVEARMVRNGLSVILAALSLYLVLGLLSMLGLMLLVLLFGSKAGHPLAVAAGIVIGLVLVVGVVAQQIATFVGYCLCHYVPARAGGRGWISATLVLAGVSFVGGVAVNLAMLTLGLQPRAQVAIPLLLFAVVVGLIDLARWLTFLIFLRSLAHRFAALWLSESIGNLLFLIVLLTGALIVPAGLLAVAFVGRAMPEMLPLEASTLVGILILSVICSCLEALAFLVAVAWYLRVIRDCRNLIDSAFAEA